MRVLRLAIEKVVGWHASLFLEPHAVACAAILTRYSGSPAAFDLEWQKGTLAPARPEQRRLLISWSDRMTTRAERLRRTTQRKQLVEMAALALAFLVAYRVARLREWDVTRYGEHVDYRSLQRKIVLEVSGTESPRLFERRHRQKLLQAAQNPWGFSSLVVICGFFAAGHRIRVTEQLPYQSR
jgi:hypothetical protein